MKLVILAAGKGKRMGESSNHTPKPILKYRGKTLIHHKLEQLPKDIEEIIIVIGHLGDKIIDTIGNNYRNIPITYIQQGELLGTGHSLWQAKEAIGNQPFLVLMGDDLYSNSDLELMNKAFFENPSSWIALVEKRDDHIAYGKCIFDENGYLIDFRNDPEREVPDNYMYTGACLLTPEVFELPLFKISGAEYGLPHTFVQEGRHLLRSGDQDGKKGGKLNILPIQTTYWKRITSPEDLTD